MSSWRFKSREFVEFNVNVLCNEQFYYVSQNEELTGSVFFLCNFIFKTYICYWFYLLCLDAKH